MGGKAGTAAPAATPFSKLLLFMATPSGANLQSTCEDALRSLSSNDYSKLSILAEPPEKRAREYRWQTRRPQAEGSARSRNGSVVSASHLPLALPLKTTGVCYGC